MANIDTVPIKKYVNVKSTIPSSTNFTSNLCGRFFLEFSQNSYVPTKSILEFKSADEVAELFGVNSFEYKLSVEYFGFTNKSNGAPTLISFAGFNTSVTNPFIRTKRINIQDICTALKQISDGILDIKVNGMDNIITGLDFTHNVNVSDYLTTIQDGLDNIFGSDALNGYTIEYVSSIECLVLKKNNAVVKTLEIVEVDTGSGTDISKILQLDTASNPYNNNGEGYNSIAECLDYTETKSDKFGSFGFINKELNSNDLADIHTFITAKKDKYLFSMDVNPTNYNTISELTKNYDNFVLNYSTQTDTMAIPAFFMPMAIMASINFDGYKTTQNFGLQSFPNMKVESCNESLFDDLTGKNININCRLQQAGNYVDRYQQGVCSNGTATNIVANRIWLDTTITFDLFNYLDNVNKIPKTTAGKTALDNVVISCLDNGVNNGAIMTGVAGLEDTQKTIVDNILGGKDLNDVYLELAQSGYYLQSSFAKIDGKDTYIATIIYMADVIIQFISISNIILK